MLRTRFEELNGPAWSELDKLLEQLERGRFVEAERAVALYRRVCQHLALVRHRHLGADLEERLNGLALRAHQQLYRREVPWRSALGYLAAGFPRDVRRQWRAVLAASLLFWGPFLLMLGLVQVRPDLAYAVLGTEQLAAVEQMYDPASPDRWRVRGADSDVLMFGHYVRNNVGIALQTFGGGVLFGLGSVFFLVFNGLVIGTVAGHLTRIGYGETFWPFVSGHSAFELSAIVLAGAAGLRLGGALLAPGQRSRARALREEALDSAGLIWGFAVLLVLAAAVEAFWSPRLSVPAEVKYAVGLSLWGLFLGYLLLGGRGRAAR